MRWNKNENVSIKWFNFVQAREKEKEQKKLLKFFFLIATGEISDQKSLFYRGKWKFPLVVDMRGDVVWVFLLTDKLEFKKISCDLQMHVPTFCHLRVCLFHSSALVNDKKIRRIEFICAFKTFLFVLRWHES